MAGRSPKRRSLAVSLGAVALAGSLSFLSASDAEVLEFKIDTTACAIVKDWGLTVAPLEEDGQYVLPSEGTEKALYRDLTPTSVRILVEPDWPYDIVVPSIDRKRAEKVLGPQIDRLRTYGISRYVISVIAPPTFTRSYTEYIFGLPDHIQTEAEDRFCAHLTSMLDFIRARGSRLPEAISFCAMPDFGGECIYTPQQWARVGTKLRTSMDSAGFKNVSLIGPESYTPSGLLKFIGSGSPNAFLQGVAFSLGEDRLFAREDFVRASDLTEVLRERGMDIWSMDGCRNSAADENEAMLALFQRMGRDMIIFRSDHWFLSYGYTRALESDSLLSGPEGERSASYEPIRTLWTQMPIGAEVHRLIPLGATSNSDAPDVTAFALVRGDFMILVLVNDMTHARSYLIREVRSLQERGIVYYGAGRSSAARLRDADGDLEVEIPRKSLGLISIHSSK